MSIATLPRARTVPAQTALRLALYEPFGAGGICHYTYQLAQGLSHLGVDVSVLTPERYELASLPRRFTLDTRIERSQIKQALARLLGRDRRREPAPTDGGGVAGAPAAAASPAPSDRGSLLRWGVIWVETVRSLLRSRTNVVHFQWILQPERDLYLVRLLRLLGIPVVYTAHNVLPHETTSPRERERYARLYRAVDRVIVHAERNRTQVVGEFGVQPGRVSVIPHGSYDLFFGPVPVPTNEARRMLGIPADRRVVLFFGGIRRYKGLEYLIEAFEDVRRRIPEAFLLVVGTIVTGTGPERAFCAEVLRRLAPSEHVRHVGEYVPLDAIKFYFAAADVVALPYVETSQSGVLLSAYAAGKAVVVTDTGGMGEIVEVGENGLVVPPRDSAALADALAHVLADRERAEAMGRHSLHLGTTRYSWDRVATLTLEAYRQVCRC